LGFSEDGGGGGGAGFEDAVLVVTLSGAAGRHLTPKKPSSQVSLALHKPRQGSASQRPFFSLHRSPCWQTA
jgi:hypothetical protein